MSPATIRESHDVLADINYWPPEGVGEDLIHGQMKARYLGVGDEYTRKMPITDIRGREDDFTWQEHGFQVIKLPKRERHEFDKAWVKESFFPELTEVMKDVTGAQHVFWMAPFCRAAPETTNEMAPDPESPERNGPSANAHADFSTDDNYMIALREVLSMTGDFTPEERSILLGARRWAIFNIWKPRKTVQRDPLALCDCRSVPATDRRIKKRVVAGKVIGATSLSHGNDEDTHRWYYLHEQSPEEMWIFRGYDTDKSTPGFPTAHTAIRVPDVGLDKLPARESIEARCFLVWD